MAKPSMGVLGGAMPNVGFNQSVPDMASSLPQIVAGDQQSVPMPAILSPQYKTWAKVLGTIGDALQTAGGGKGTFMPMMLDQQAKLDEERKWQAQMAQQLQIAQDRLNKPPNPTQLQSNYEYAKTQDPALSFQKFMQLYHPQMFGGFDGQYQMTQPQPPEGLTPMSPEELKALGLNPGGPTPPASGNFR